METGGSQGSSKLALKFMACSLMHLSDHPITIMACRDVNLWEDTLARRKSSNWTRKKVE